MQSQKLHLGLLSQTSNVGGIIWKEVVFQVVLSHNFMHGFASTKLKTSLIASFHADVRSRAGVDPGHLFTTNSSEAINHVIKQEVEWKECKLPQLISHLKAITAQHQAELEKAIVGRGEWHFCQQYATLQISESVWFTKMTPEAKTRQVHSCQLKQIMPQMTATTHENTKQPHIAHLSVSVENAGLSTISYSTLSSMWNKAEKLVLSEGHILKAQSLSDEKARLVKSSSSPQPHVVQTKSSNIDITTSVIRTVQCLRGFHSVPMLLL